MTEYNILRMRNEIQNPHNTKNRQNPNISACRKNALPLFHVNTGGLENTGMGSMATKS